MPVWICKACAVEHPDTVEPPEFCVICSDERQYVPMTGQAWTTLDELEAAGTTLAITEVEPELYGVNEFPQVGIGQRMHVVRTDAGNVLWDPTGYVDAAGAAAVLALGPVVAICASHPHMYGVQVEWSRALGGVPVLVSEKDASWVQRPDAVIQTFADGHQIVPGVELHTPGGHFPGQAVLLWSAGAGGRGVLLSGDTVFPGPDGKWLSYMRSYPNYLPLSMAVVERVAQSLLDLRFERIYGNFGQPIPSDAHGVLRRSADRQVEWMRGDHDDLTT